MKNIQNSSYRGFLPFHRRHIPDDASFTGRFS